MKSKKGIGLVAFIIIFVIILIIGAVAVVLLMTGNKDNKGTNTTVATKNEDIKTEKSVNKEEQFDPEKWGVVDSIVVKKNDMLETGYIKFTTLKGIVRGTGKIAYQTDKTLVILDGERADSPVLTSDFLDSIFPTYFEQTKSIIDSYRQMNYDNFEFSVDSKKIEIINGYEMCKYTGQHTFTLKDSNSGKIENCKIEFVAYATKLKANDAVVYWMVLDDTEDQSLTKTIEDYAYKMALTLKES